MNQPTRHSIYLIIAYILTSGLNYAFGVGLSWFFSPTEFGVLGVAQSLLLLFSLAVGSGFAWSVVHFIAAEGMNDDTRAKFRTALLANFFLAVLIGGGLWAAFTFKWISLGPAYQVVIPLTAMTVLLLALRGVTNGVIRGVYSFGVLSVNFVGEVSIKVLFGIIFVSIGWGVSGVMLGFVLGAALSLLHSLWAIRSQKMFVGKEWYQRGVIISTLPLFISMFGVALMLNLDVLGLRLLTRSSIGDELSGYYQAAVILARTPVFFAQALTIVLYTYVAGAVHSTMQKKNSLAYNLTAAIRSWFRFLLPVSAVMIFAPKSVLGLFFPPHYLASTKLLQISALGGLILALVTLINGVLQAEGSNKSSAIVLGLATIFQVLSLVWLVPHLGTSGAAYSLWVAGGVALVGYSPHLWKLWINWKEAHGLNLYKKLVREGLPLLLLSFLLLTLPQGDRWISLLKLFTSGIIYWIVLILLQGSTLKWNLFPGKSTST